MANSMTNATINHQAMYIKPMTAAIKMKSTNQFKPRHAI
nr:MAG TPA: hypothetical protein [Caudoviricetes sp.]